MTDAQNVAVGDGGTANTAAPATTSEPHPIARAAGFNSLEEYAQSVLSAAAEPRDGDTPTEAPPPIVIPQHYQDMADWLADPTFDEAFVVGSVAFWTCTFCKSIATDKDAHIASHSYRTG